MFTVELHEDILKTFATCFPNAVILDGEGQTHETSPTTFVRDAEKFSRYYMEKTIHYWVIFKYNDMIQCLKISTPKSKIH